MLETEGLDKYLDEYINMPRRGHERGAYRTRSEAEAGDRSVTDYLCKMSDDYRKR